MRNFVATPSLGFYLPARRLLRGFIQFAYANRGGGNPVPQKVFGAGRRRAIFQAERAPIADHTPRREVTALRAAIIQ